MDFRAEEIPVPDIIYGARIDQTITLDAAIPLPSFQVSFADFDFSSFHQFMYCSLFNAHVTTHHLSIYTESKV